jgi:uncharacterized protein (DUF1778 family)
MCTTVTISAKTSRRNLRVSPADDELFQRAADSMGESVSEFLVESARERAEMVLADRTHFALDGAAWTEFVAALDRPPQADPQIVKLIRRPRPG